MIFDAITHSIPEHRSIRIHCVALVVFLSSNSSVDPCFWRSHISSHRYSWAWACTFGHLVDILNWCLSRWMQFVVVSGQQNNERSYWKCVSSMPWICIMTPKSKLSVYVYWNWILILFWQHFRIVSTHVERNDILSVGDGSSLHFRSEFRTRNGTEFADMWKELKLIRRLFWFEGRQSGQCENFDCSNQHSDECWQYFLVLLRRHNDHGHISSFLGDRIRIVVVSIAIGIAKILSIHHCEWQSAQSTRWIRHYGFEFGGICEGQFQFILISKWRMENFIIFLFIFRWWKVPSVSIWW